MSTGASAHFWYDFIVGDDPKIAFGVAIVLVLGAALVGTAGAAGPALVTGLAVLLHPRVHDRDGSRRERLASRTFLRDDVLSQPEYAWPGTEDDLLHLVAQHPWVTLVSATSHGLTISPLPVVPAPDATGVEVLGHLARTDAEEHELGECDAVIVVQGHHGYISAAWYAGGPYVPTWNYVVAHLHGRPSSLAPCDVPTCSTAPSTTSSRRVPSPSGWPPSRRTPPGSLRRSWASA